MNTILITAAQMQQLFTEILIKNGMTEEAATSCAAVFTQNSVDGVYTHGYNRFARFVQYIQKGWVKTNVQPKCVYQFNGMEQWDGQLGAGILNAIHCTNRVVTLAKQSGIGCVALQNTNHWMRGGTYAWQATQHNVVFIAWTNTIANMPAWGAVNAKLGNNPLVIGLPYNNSAIVLDMAMSQYSFGAMELAAMQKQEFPVAAGFNQNNQFTHKPAEVLQTRRPLPIGYWKGAGLALLLDILAAVLSGGLATTHISGQQAEKSLSQVFIAIDISKLPNHSAIPSLLNSIIEDYRLSIAQDEASRITYPGERVLQTRQNNMANGIPVLQNIWQTIEALK